MIFAIQHKVMEGCIILQGHWMHFDSKFELYNEAKYDKQTEISRGGGQILFPLILDVYF